MTEAHNTPENGLSPSYTILILTVIGIECIIGIIANGFITAIHAAEWIQNKAVSTSGRILFFLSVSRLGLQSFMMLDTAIKSTSPHFYNSGIVYSFFNISLVFFNYCSIWFATWLSFFYFVKTADCSCLLFLKLKWRISRLMPWFLWLSVFISLGYSVLFSKDIYIVHCNNSLSMTSSNSTKKKFFHRSNVASLLLTYNLGISVPLIVFILAGALMIISLKRHTLHMKSNATGSRNPNMEAHLGAIKAISYFLILSIFYAVALFLHISSTFEANSSWDILCNIIMAAYPAGHSVLLIVDNPGLRRAWNQIQHQLHFYLKE